jgi:hypothetical protein
MNEDKVRENYHRRQARRLGLTLQKSRARKWSIDNNQQYRIIDARTNHILAGEKYDFSLDQINMILIDYEKGLMKKA